LPEAVPDGASNLTEALAGLTRADVARLTPSERTRIAAMLAGESINVAPSDTLSGGDRLLDDTD
jgi:hypothetical protein